MRRFSKLSPPPCVLWHWRFAEVATTLQLENFDFSGVRLAKDGWRGEKGEESGKGDRDTPQRGASRVSARLPSSGPGHHPWTTRRTFPVVSDPNSHRWGGVACYKEPKKKQHEPLQKDLFVFFCLSRGEEEERRERVCKRERETEKERETERERERLRNSREVLRRKRR